MVNPVWNDVASTRLKDLWEKGLTARNIAEHINKEFELGVTRNSVIGKARRLGCVQRPSPLRPPRPKDEAPPKRRTKPMHKPPAKLVTIRPLPRRQPKTLEEVQASDGCRFPLGERYAPAKHFCGAPRVNPDIGLFAGGNPYCLTHHRLTRIPDHR